MIQPFIIPITTSHGEYYIKLTAIDPEIAVSRDCLYLYKDCTIYDILLACDRRDVFVDSEVLTRICSELQRVLELNPNIILYFFCDDNSKNIRINNSNKNISPQKYRSLLFSRLYERTLSKGNNNQYINKRYEVDMGTGEKQYIHLIYPEHLTKQASLLASTIKEQTK